MVSELGAGGQQPSSPMSLPGGAAAVEPYPAGTMSVVPASPPGAPAPDAPPPPQQQGQQQQVPAEPHADAMLVDAPLSRSHSPALSAGMGTAAALRPPLHQPSGFVPLSEVGGAPRPQQHPQQHLLEQPEQPSRPASTSPDSSLEAPSCRPDRPPSAAGYESGDDMDVLSMRHCTNCTGTLWGHICMDCGHMPAHDDDIFAPTVASSTALHRPRLQGDALTVLCWDERMELHEEAGSSMHPERPDRVRAVMARLQAAELAGRCRRLPGREASADEITACHIPELVEAVDVLSEQARLAGGAGLHFSPDTYTNQHTALCAKLSAGACVDVARAVVRGEACAGVAVVRPPGHHAESNTAMGFCFFNNAGIAARAAQGAGAGRVLVLDWDVHHGNGTQHIFEDDPSVLYMSLHRYDGGSFYPGTGAAHEVGEGAGEGFTVNVPWPCGGMRNGDYLAAFTHVVLPIAYEYAPDLVIISAGFDAAEGDPIGGCHLTPEAYAHMAAQLQLVAPTVALLEGGYNLLSTAAGTEAVVRVLLGERPPALPAAEGAPGEYGLAAVAQAMRIQARYWVCMRGLVQQQFKVLAAAAARQEQLAGMKARRAEALAGGRHSTGSGLASGDECEDGDGGDGVPGSGEEEDEGEREARLMPPPHRPPLPGFEAHDEAEADTPHQQYRGGSGWESDAELASDDDAEVSEDSASDEERLLHPQPAGAPPQEPAEAAQQQEELAGGDASPPRACAALSDTAPISYNSDAAGSGSASDGNNNQPRARTDSVGLTSGALSPPTGAGAGVPTPAAEQLLAASATPASEPAVAPQGEGDAGAAAAPEEGGPAPAPPAGGWQGLAVKPVRLKRPGHVHSHHRLSPVLLDAEAMALVQPRAPQQQQQEQQEQEHVVPQQAV